MSPKEILSRLTGISCPIFGVEWDPPEPEISFARRAISFLEDRRVLYNTSGLENIADCIESVLEIRRFLTEEISKVSESSRVAEQLRVMRAACRRLLDQIQESRESTNNFGFLTALGGFRTLMGVHIGILAVMHGISVESPLDGILPPAVAE